jgi:hypothetical protein
LATEGEHLTRVAAQTDGPSTSENAASPVREKLTIDFPNRRSLGELYILDDDGKTQFHSEALGTVEVPAGAKLSLYFSFDPIYGCIHLADVPPYALNSISFLGSDITDGELQHVGKLIGLKELDVSCTQVSDVGLSHIKELKSLTNLNLSSTRISNYGLNLLTELTMLRELLLDDTEIGDDALNHIGCLNNLVTLSLSFTDVTDKGLTKIRNIKSLEKLRLNCTEISDDGLVYVASMPALKQLWLRSTKVSYPGLVELTKWLPHCEIII